jgi:hypothetical protein
MAAQKKTYSVADVERIRQELREAPPYQPTALSKQKTIASLAPEIFDMRQKGHRWDDIAAWLSKRDVQVSSAALRTYLRRMPAEPASKKPRRQRPSPALANHSPTVARAIARTPDSTPREPAPPVRLVAAGSPTALPSANASGEPPRERPRFDIRPDTKDR